MAAPGRQRRCSTTPATAGASILRRIWRGVLASCRPTPMTGSTSPIWRDATWTDPGSGVLGPCAAPVLRHGRYRRECASQGRRQEGEPRSRPSRSRSCGGSMHCSRSSAPSMAGCPEERLETRQTLSRPLVEDLQVYMRERSPSCSVGTTWPRRPTTS